MKYNFADRDFVGFRQLLKTPKKIVITTHYKPDGDAIGSSLGLYNFFGLLNHRVTVVSPSDYPEFLWWMTGHSEVINYLTQQNIAETLKAEADLIFCLDFNMSDSVLDYKPMLPAGRSIIATTPLFSIGDSVYDANDWVNYANTYRFKQDGSGAKPWPQVREEFEQFMMVNYYRDHLEEFNEDFKNQMNEFKDGNIFFEIMQQEVWNKALSDTAALLALYERNKKNYLWKQSADAIVFFCADETTARMAYDQLKKNPGDWKKVADSYTEKIVADSSRYEWDQLPNMNKMAPKAGLITTPVVNKTDNTASFAYIVHVNTQPVQRSFNEAKGLVINDYQAVLEQQWDEELRKKYPVVIDQKVLAERRCRPRTRR